MQITGANDVDIMLDEDGQRKQDFFFQFHKTVVR